MKKAVLLITIALCCVSSIAQESDLPRFITDSLKSYITRGMREWQIPGLSIVIVRDGEIAYMKGFGVKKAGSTDPVDENTLFMIGANTTTFTATAMAVLQEEGKLHLDEKVQKWMPEFKLKNPFAAKEINISDLLSHRTGFETFQDNFTFWKSNLTRAEIIQKMGAMDAPYSLRTYWGYCTPAYVAAGELIPRITGKSWEETIRAELLTPLNMNRTLMLSEEFKNASNIAVPHTIINDRVIELPVANIDNIAPAGSMSSCAKDMASWLLAQLDNGTINGELRIPGKAILAIRQPYSIIGVDARDDQETHFSLFGLGLIINDCNERLVYSQEGGIDGFLSFVMFIPEESLGIVVLTNSDKNMFFMALPKEIRDAFLGLPYQGYSDRMLNVYNYEKTRSAAIRNYMKNMMQVNDKPDFPLSAYTGTFINGIYGEIRIRSEEGKLVMHFSHHPALKGTLDYLQKNTFLCTFSDPTLGIQEIPFKTTKGKITGFTLHVSDDVDPSYYDFAR
jgi:CubicO group peptidase (beta-lactamase class C family)